MRNMIDPAIVKSSQKIVEHVFKDFRTELLEHYGTIAFESKEDASPVTELDVKIENTLKERLLADFPTLGFKGEETEEVIGSDNAIWYVDPIDGTGSFIHGLPYCSNMAALVVDGEVVASVLYRFVQDEMFTAVKGEGAFKNDQRLHVNERMLSDSYVFADSPSYRNLYSYYAPSKIKFYAPVGATGHFLASIAEGSIQGACYYGANIKPHDVAPGMLIVLEAGGDAVTFEEKSFNFTSRRFIIGTPNICNVSRSFQTEIISKSK